MNNNTLIAARNKFKAANEAFSHALQEHRDLVPKVPRVCPVTGKHHTNECDEYLDFIYGDFTPKKFAALLKVYPGASALTSLAEAAASALAVLQIARSEDKALKAAAKDARAEKAAYRAAHGGRPLPENKNAAANWDVLNPALWDYRTLYVERCLTNARRAAEIDLENAKPGKAPQYKFNEAAVREAANASFDGYVAKLATKIALPITKAVSLTGDLWVGSVLTVELADGSRQVWSTHCIWNARYGANSANGHYTPYVQFPTVRVS